MAAPLEIERKWMVLGWPEDCEEDLPDGSLALPVLEERAMEQGYVTTKPTVRIRREGPEDYVLCFKSKSKDKGLSRTEIELSLSEEEFEQLKELIGLPLIQKVRRTYVLPDGCRLEVNHVDEGQPTEFWYAEVEFDSVDAAQNWRPADVGLEHYLHNEVTGQKGQSMAAYWRSTREQ